MGEFGIGQSVPREEDPYLVRGQGRYLDDITMPGELRACFLRSPHGHARIRSIDPSAARAMPGVVRVMTGHDAEVMALGTQHPRPRHRRDGSPAQPAPQFHLARDRVRYIGEPVAVVVAETLAEAKDAAEAIAANYDLLPAVITPDQAVAPGAPLLHDACPGNVAFVHQGGNRAAADQAFATADRIVRHRMVVSRLTTNSLEPRGCLAEHAARDGRFTLRVSAQNPHLLRRTLADIFTAPENRFRVISEKVGGGFGMKGGLYPEYVLCMLAAQLTGRPVKWVAERSEGFLSDEHGRDVVADGELALDRNGRFLALRVRTLNNCGAYYNSDRHVGPMNNIGVIAGTYVIPAIHVDMSFVVTNTMLVGAYRGNGRPEAAYMIETLVDLAARALDLDPAELRRRNMISAAAMPYKTALTYTYDCGDFGRNLADCLQLADYAGFAARRADSEQHGRLRGIGIASTVEASNAGMIEHAEIRFDPSGTATVFVGTHDHGQGHQTTFRQIVADRLGLAPGQIGLRFGDTDQVMIGTGTFGSRSTVLGGSAIILAADKIIAKARKIAAHMLEAGEHDIAFAAGQFTVAGTDRSVGLAEVASEAFVPAKLPPGLEPGLFETATVDGNARTFPNGCHISEVEIDRDTGVVELVRYAAVDDVGHMINPLLVEGQLRGGIAMGAGQALMEQIHYDTSGQLLSGSFQDYCMPRAHHFPDIVLGENEVPTGTNPLGVKGAGESGTVGALPSVMNAVNDALARIGVPYLAMPASPEKVWQAIRTANASRR
jgi:aerobic carbon-monoxide dehydrogenase large subunit